MVPKRLAFRLILSLTAIVVLAEGIFGVISVKTQEDQLLRSMILGADQLSRAISSATWHSMLADRRDAAYEVMQTIAVKQGIDRIRIFNKEGRVMFSTASDVGRQVDKRAEACFLCHAESTPLVRVDVPTRARIFRGEDGRRRLAMVTPIYNERACSEAVCHAHPPEKKVLGVLDVGLSLGEVDAELWRIRLRVVLVVILEVVLIGLFIVYFSKRFVGSPIRQLIEGTRRVSSMELDQPIVTQAGGEMAQLARAFDDMRIRLKESMEALNQLTRTLEARVEDRTRQLQRTQQKLIQSDRLASLGRLSATVAHEINNPLSGILNLSMVMQRMLKEDGVPPERMREFRSHLEQVTRETERVGRIVSDLLAFSRQSRPRIGKADLNEVVRSTLSVIDHKIRLEGSRVALELEPDLPPVYGDAAQLQQVVLNLAMNAVEATPGGGDLRVRTRSTSGTREVVLEVSDTGIGIPASILPKIFDPFFTTKEEAKGTGLGLAVVYGIVEAHGGDIEVESEPGRGTTFRVKLSAWDTGAGPSTGAGSQDHDPTLGGTP